LRDRGTVEGDKDGQQEKKKEEKEREENHVVHVKSISIKSALKGATREIPVADEEIDEWLNK